LRQRLLPTGLADGRPAARRVAAWHIGVGGEAGGEAGEPLFDVADAADDQRDQPRAEPVAAAEAGHGLGQAPEQGGDVVGRGGG